MPDSSRYTAYVWGRDIGQPRGWYALCLLAWRNADRDALYAALGVGAVLVALAAMVGIALGAARLVVDSRPHVVPTPHSLVVCGGQEVHRYQDLARLCDGGPVGSRTEVSGTV